MKNVRKHRDIIFITTETRRNYLVSKPNYHAAIEIRKPQIFMNKPVYLGLWIIDLSKIVMYKFWYDYGRSQYNKKTYGYRKFHCLHKFRWHLRRNYELDKPSPRGKKMKVIKDKLGRKIMKELFELREKNLKLLNRWWYWR